MGEPPASPPRIVSLDQFRGYTVAGMFLVNFVGGFAFVQAYLPTLKHWHDHCSYADTIMPQFLFAVGFAYRLTFLRRLQAGDGWATYGHAIRRNLGLLLVAFVVYHLDGRFGSWADLQAAFHKVGPGRFLAEQFQRNFFQTLAHIAVTSLWVLPVIAAGPAPRVAFLIASAVLHVWLSLNHGYYAWEMRRPGIDGGPLGFLTWTTPLLVGSLAYDCLVARGPRGAVRPLLLWGLAVMALAYALANLNPLTPPNATPGEPLAEQLKALPVEPPFVRPSRPATTGRTTG